jgi:hypothetical protein
MGTRSLTKIYDGDTLLVTLYAQYDGYMAGHGKDLAGILQGKKMVNGFGDCNAAAFNGAGCMAATIIASLKKGIGNYYIQAPGSYSDNDVDYVYTIRSVDHAAPTITVTSYEDTVFEGSVEEFYDATVYQSEID